MKRTLYIHPGFHLDTEEGIQIIESQYGETCYIVRNYTVDDNGNPDRCTGTSYLTEREILRKYSDMLGHEYTSLKYTT